MKSYILSKKNGHSIAIFNTIINGLVDKGAVVVVQFSIFDGVAIKIPENLVKEVKKLSQVIDIEVDQEVVIYKRRI
jgi:hypothetical protein